MSRVMVICTALFCAVLGAAGQILFKIGSKTLKFDISLLTNYHLIGGLALYATSTVLFIYALKFEEVSTLYPIIATSYIWVTLIAMVFLHESITINNWIGLLLILGGVYFIVK